MTKRTFLKALALACVAPRVLLDAQKSLAGAPLEGVVTYADISRYLDLEQCLNLVPPGDFNPSNAENFDAYWNTTANELRVMLDGDWIPFLASQ